MAEFNFDWDDFRFGLCVINTDTSQPKSSWKGYNVTIADDDSMLVPIYAPTQLSLTGATTTSGAIDNGSSQTSWSNPVYFNGYVVVQARTSSYNTVHFINTSTGAVTSVNLPDLGTGVTDTPVVIPDSTDVIAYVVNGTSDKLYKVQRSTSTTTTYTLPAHPSSQGYTGLCLWGARMLAWSNTSDQFFFSDATTSNVFDTASWSALNYIGVGYNGDGISYVIPRNQDLVVAKPSGWYSITGVLGFNAALRKMNDAVGILSTDTVAQNNNAIYFVTPLGYSDYAINLMQISGAFIDIAAYQRFGIGDSNVRVSKTNLGYLAVAAVIDEENGSQSGFAMMQEVAGRWQPLKTSRFTTGSNPTFNFASGQTSRYNNTQDKNLYLCEYTSGASSNKFAVIKVKPNTIEPGQNSSYAPSSGTVRLSNISTKTPIIIRQVYVEAEMMQIPTVGTMHSYTGSASITATVYNRSVSDLSYSNADGSPTAVASSSYSYPYSDFAGASVSSIVSQQRVIRFNLDTAAWGYNHEIELTFAGLRIRRVWVKGDMR